MTRQQKPTHRAPAIPTPARSRIIIAAALGAITALVYAQIAQHEFTVFDDGDYITQNVHVQEGLTLDGVVWAFTTGHAGNWHPLTWLSHMLDCQLFGLNPSGHHLTSLFLHIVSTIVLLLALHRMTGALWQSAFVAAVFALHPLHVESVAWAAERKDVLSGVFWMLTLLAYVRYVERPSLLRYLPVILFFALGLMSKPMLVTLPFVLLLLDYWPFGRFGRTSKRPAQHDAGDPARHTPVRILTEKVPMLLLATASAAATFLAQREAGSVLSDSFMSWGARIDNAVYAYVEYVGKALWPVDLAVFYPHKEGSLPTVYVVGLAALLLGASWMAYRLRERHPYIPVGWFWYTGTLVPVIGIVQVGGQAMADRYMYIPLIGLSIVAAWGSASVILRFRLKTPLVVGVVSLLLGTMMVRTWNQTQTWRDDVALFTQAIAAVPNNTLAYNNLGVALQIRGRLNEAVEYYRHALTLKGDYEHAHDNLVGVLLALNRGDEAAVASNRMGELLGKQGRYEAAESRLREALRLRPDHADAHNNLGIVLALQGKDDEAAVHFEEALHFKPDHTDAKHNLEVVRSKKEHPARETITPGTE